MTDRDGRVAGGGGLDVEHESRMQPCYCDGEYWATIKKNIKKCKPRVLFSFSVPCFKALFSFI